MAGFSYGRSATRRAWESCVTSQRSTQKTVGLYLQGREANVKWASHWPNTDQFANKSIMTDGNAVNRRIQKFIMMIQHPVITLGPPRLSHVFNFPIQTFQDAAITRSKRSLQNPG